MTTKRARRGWGKLRKLPSGKYQASYVGPDLMRHTAPHTFTLKSDAEHWLGSERRLTERQTWTAPTLRTQPSVAPVITLSTYGQRWIKERSLKERTRPITRRSGRSTSTRRWENFP